MLERGLHYTPTNSSPKLNLGEKKTQRNQNERRGVREYKIEQLENRRILGLVLRHLKLEETFSVYIFLISKQILVSSFIPPSNQHLLIPEGNACFVSGERIRMAEIWPSQTPLLSFCHVKAEHLSCGLGYGQRRTRLV